MQFLRLCADSDQPRKSPSPHWQTQELNARAAGCDSRDGQGVGNEDDLLPRVHHVVLLLKRWLLGTHHGAVSPEHLDYYLDEYTFRFNRRTSRHRGKLFYRLMQQAVAVDPAPYDQMIKHVRGRPKHNR